MMRCETLVKEETLRRSPSTGRGWSRVVAENCALENFQDHGVASQRFQVLRIVL